MSNPLAEDILYGWIDRCAREYAVTVTYDSIIVGGGSAGCVLAARLSGGRGPPGAADRGEGPAYPPDGYPADLTGLRDRD